MVEDKEEWARAESERESEGRVVGRPRGKDGERVR